MVGGGLGGAVSMGIQFIIEEISEANRKLLFIVTVMFRIDNLKLFDCYSIPIKNSWFMYINNGI